MKLLIVAIVCLFTVSFGLRTRRGLEAVYTKPVKQGPHQRKNVFPSSKADHIQAPKPTQSVASDSDDTSEEETSELSSSSEDEVKSEEDESISQTGVQLIPPSDDLLQETMKEIQATPPEVGDSSDEALEPTSSTDLLNDMAVEGGMHFEGFSYHGEVKQNEFGDPPELTSQINVIPPTTVLFGKKDKKKGKEGKKKRNLKQGKKKYLFHDNIDDFIKWKDLSTKAETGSEDE